MALTYTLDFEKQRLYFIVSLSKDLVTEYENMEKIKMILLHTLCHDMNYVTVLF